MKKLFIFLFLFVLISSCIITLSYKSSKIRKEHSNVYIQIKKLSSSIKKDLNKRKNIYNSLNIEYNNYLAKKYPEMNRTLLKMELIFKKVKTEEKFALKLKKEVYLLTKNKKKIKSDKPEWDKYDIIRDKAKALNNRVEDLNDKYQDLAEDYNDIAKNAGIKEVTSKKIKKQFEANSKKLKNIVRLYENKVDKFIKKYSSDSDKSDKLNEIKRLLAKINNKNNDIKHLIESFNNRLKGKKKIYIIKNADSVVHQIKKAYDEINELGVEINKISKKL